MSITYNQHSKERENVVAPSVEDMEQSVEFMNEVLASVIFSKDFDNVKVKEVRKKMEVMQRLIWHYENLQHFYTVVGGWEGFNKLLFSKAKNDLQSTDTSIRECEGICQPITETERIIFDEIRPNGLPYVGYRDIEVITSKDETE